MLSGYFLDGKNRHYGYNIQWLVCQLHTNELPLRHLISVKDGKSKGPNSFSGPIGKSLIGCEKLPITPFEIISGDEIIVDIPDLSTDQKYLAEMHRAVTTGFVNESLSQRDPGNINLSRWLTIANCILWLYVSTHEPTPQLIAIVDYIVKVYIPT